MKYFKTFVVIFVLACSCTFSVKAQDGPDKKVDIHVSASVTSSIQVKTLHAITTKGAERNNNLIEVLPLRDSNAGLMKATGKANARVIIEFIENDVIFNTRGDGSISVHYLIAYNHEKNQTTADLLLNQSKVLTFSETGELYIWIGSRIDISNATPGEYPANFVIKIEYI